MAVSAGRDSWLRFLLPLWVLFMVILSLSPLTVKEQLHTTGNLHYWGHFIMFAITAVLALWWTPLLRSQVWRAGMVVILGLLLETAETVVYHNLFERLDLLVDIAGVTAGSLAVWVTFRFRLRPCLSS